MKAARIDQPGDPISIDGIPIPDINENEVLMKVTHVGLNTGDLHIRERGGFYRSEKGHLFPDLPMTVGHEGLGEIVEVGKDVRGVQVGDMAMPEPSLTCGFCKHCRNDVQHLCEYKRVMGFLTWGTELHDEDKNVFQRYKDGLAAEYCRLPGTNVEPLQPGDDPDDMYLINQLAYGYRGLKRASLNSGETVIVNGGTGMVGLGAVLSALAKGAAHVIVTARNKDRLAHVRSSNPDRISTIPILDESIEDRVMELTNGQGAQVLIDTTPQGIDSFHDCMRSLEPGGRIVILGGNTETIEFEYKWFNANHFTLTADAGMYYNDIPELMNLIRRDAIDLSPMEIENFELDQANEVIDFLATYDGPTTKFPVVRPH